MKWSALVSAYRQVPRPIRFGLEVGIGLVAAVAGAWLADKAGQKSNAKANADIRASFAQVGIETELREEIEVNKRIAAALERAYPERPRPSLLHPAIRIITAPPEPEPCMADSHKWVRKCNGGHLATLGGTTDEP